MNQRRNQPFTVSGSLTAVRADHHARHAGVQQCRNVIFRAHTATNLYGTSTPATSFFNSGIWRFAGSFAPVNPPVQHLCTLSGTILQAGQRIVTVSRCWP